MRAKLRLLVGVVLVTALAFRVGHALASGKRYPGTLTATPNVLHAGDYFTVNGCGYDTSLGNVVIGFTGGSWALRSMRTGASRSRTSRRSRATPCRMGPTT